MNEPTHTAVTYRLERWRAIASGILETAGTTFLLVIAVRWYQAGAMAKALVAGGASVGLLVSPLTVWLVSRKGWQAARAAAWIAWLGAVGFLLMACLPFLPVFVLASVMAMTATGAGIPLLTQIYQENYPERERGRLFSRTMMIRIGVSTSFSYAAGWALDRYLSCYPLLLLVFSAAFAAAG